MSAAVDPTESKILREIGALSDRMRDLRADKQLDGAKIKALEGESRSKWEELRLLRAGGVVVTDMSSPRRRGLYI